MTARTAPPRIGDKVLILIRPRLECAVWRRRRKPLAIDKARMAAEDRLKIARGSDHETAIIRLLVAEIPACCGVELDGSGERCRTLGANIMNSRAFGPIRKGFRSPKCGFSTNVSSPLSPENNQRNFRATRERRRQIF